MKPGDLVKRKGRTAHRAFPDSQTGLIVRDVTTETTSRILQCQRFEVLWADGSMFIFDEPQLEVINETR
jgi:hypothetical protein